MSDERETNRVASAQYELAEEEYQGTQTPINDLELQYLTTQPAWGRESTKALHKNTQLRFRDTKEKFYKGEELTQEDHDSMWELLSFYTRDLRLGNLNPLTQEYEYCVYWINLAGDLLQEGCVKSFLSALKRAVTIIEVSQSKGGFLRKRNATRTMEQRYEAMKNDPSTRGIFGGKREN